MALDDQPVEPSEVDPDKERQLGWRVGSLAGHATARRRRAAQLAERARAIRWACEEYRVQDRAERPLVSFNPAFVRVSDAAAAARKRDWQIVKGLSGADALSLDQGEVDEPVANEPAAEGAPTEASAEEVAAANARLDLSRPPASRLVRRQSHAMSIYLTAAYLAQVEADPSGRNRRHNTRAEEGCSSWLRACGLQDGHHRADRVSPNRALKQLERAGLVRLPGRTRFAGWELLDEDGSGQAYRIPGAGAGAQKMINLPAQFFSNGWHLVLKPTELHVLFSIWDLTRRLVRGKRNRSFIEEGVALPAQLREVRYGISGETYQAIHELEEFGLIDIIDPMGSRRTRGKVRPASAVDRAQAVAEDSTLEPKPYLLVVAIEDLRPAYSQNALSVVSTCLENPVPLRLREYYELEKWSGKLTRGLF